MRLEQKVAHEAIASVSLMFLPHLMSSVIGRANERRKSLAGGNLNSYLKTVSYILLTSRSNNCIWIILSVWSCYFAGEFLKAFGIVML